MILDADSFLEKCIYSPEGLRADGRRWNELRQFKCQINTHANSSDGSSYVEQGYSKVVCIVNGPKEPDGRSHTFLDKACISVEVNIASFSTVDRKKVVRNNKRVQELNTTIQRTLEEAVLSHLYPRTQIDISIQVLQQDGGLLPTCVNAATLALIDAGIPMVDYVSACSAGIYDTTPLLDLNTMEENDLAFLTVGVIGKSDSLALLMMETRMSMDNLEPVMAIAIAGSHSIRDIMDREVRRHGKQRLAKKGNM
ncbi:ribosomal protein S5 domain 2-like protein [Nadsonia fulvescens var. elongata DSM 6958]|uniref:Ribosomal RNA-processing protein 41 n=1 Tax=Nadsonia fulvescens var. elongata DSM 6958 TaxID=857566 RepID=A0A1E3PMR7_9ASCO|nr:ribosomal protein S5 domain 2-like protein [Nadsonia fulvescens var. elongata DSM 6958]